MGKMKGYIQEFIDDKKAHSLGYDEYNLPRMEDMKEVLIHDIPVWEYYDMTEEEYYGGELVEEK